MMAGASERRLFGLMFALLSSACGEASVAGEGYALREVDEGKAPAFGTVAFEELDPVPPGGSLDDLQRALPELSGRGIALGLHWKSERIDDPLRWRIVDEAIARGIAVHPVLTLPEGREEDEQPGSLGYAQTGYFPNASNYAAWIAASKKLMEMWLARGLAPTTMVVDMEMRKRRLHRLAALTGPRPDALGTLLLLASGIDRARQDRAIAAFSAYAAHAHARGFTLHLTTLLPMLDDYRDGDDSLRQAFGVPLANDPRQIPFDVVSFQIHRTLYRERYPNLTPYFVYDYARAAVALVGGRAAIDVGLTHGGIVATAPVYTGPDELRGDLAAAMAAGIPTRNIGVYSLLGILTRPKVAAWLEPVVSARPPSDTGATASSHVEWGLLDAVLP